MSLPHIVEIPDPQESPASEVLLPDAEEQLEQDVLQPQDVDTPVCSTEDDSMEELDMGKFTAINQNIIHAHPSCWGLFYYNVSLLNRMWEF